MKTAGQVGESGWASRRKRLGRSVKAAFDSERQDSEIVHLLVSVGRLYWGDTRAKQARPGRC